MAVSGDKSKGQSERRCDRAAENIADVSQGNRPVAYRRRGAVYSGVTASCLVGRGGARSPTPPRNLIADMAGGAGDFGVECRELRDTAGRLAETIGAARASSV